MTPAAYEALALQGILTALQRLESKTAQQSRKVGTELRQRLDSLARQQNAALSLLRQMVEE